MNTPHRTIENMIRAIASQGRLSVRLINVSPAWISNGTHRPMISPGGMRASAKVVSATLRKAFHSGRTGILGVGRWMREMVDVRMRKSEGQC